jgi:hypothetical protein
MSYYMIAIEFWAAVGVTLGALPLVAVSVRGIAETVGRSLLGADHVAIHSTRTGPASV